MKQRICSKCGRKALDDGTSGKKFVCTQCDGMKLTDLRERERKVERYQAAVLRKKLKMRLCKKHGGTFRGLMYRRRTDNGVRCPVCDFKQRRMERNVRLALEAAGRVGMAPPERLYRSGTGLRNG